VVPVAIGRVFIGEPVQSNWLAVEVGFDHFRLLVRRTPQTRSAAEAAAAEIWTMCDEFWISDGPEALTYISEIANYIQGCVILVIVARLGVRPATSHSPESLQPACERHRQFLPLHRGLRQ
jgi:hypothetical protein